MKRSQAALRGAVWIAILLLITACATGSSGRERKIYPPRVTIQELRIVDAGIELDLRIDNASTVPLRPGPTEILLNGDGGIEARFAWAGDLSVAPVNVEIVRLPAMPQPAWVERMQQDQRWRYELEVRMPRADPGVRRQLRTESVLDPVPGLPGTWR